MVRKIAKIKDVGWSDCQDKGWALVHKIAKIKVCLWLDCQDQGCWLVRLSRARLDCQIADVMRNVVLATCIISKEKVVFVN